MRAMAVRADDAQESIRIEWFGQDVGDPQSARDASSIVCSADENERDGAHSRHQELLST